MRTLSLTLVLAACSNAADPGAVDAPPSVGDSATVDAAPPLDTLRVNEVVASGAPDWIEVVNASSDALELSDYCYIDKLGDVAACKPFPAMVLSPGARFVQDIDDTTSGFKLAADEEVWIYRLADHRLSDGVDWADGDSPAGQSYARIPDTTGAFERTNQVTRDAPNLPSDPDADLRVFVINEVAAGESPDWFEVVNKTGVAMELGDYCFIDSGALSACAPFPAMTLAPGAYFVQDVDDAGAGFKLGGDEELHIYRIADHAESDSVDWAEGDSPTGQSFRRIPDITGDFVTGAQTKGAANQ